MQGQAFAGFYASTFFHIPQVEKDLDARIAEAKLFGS